MKLTKYEHACLVLEEQGQKLIIDPGSMTDSFGGTAHITAVVVTHEHFDHMSIDHLQAIVTANPQVQIFAPADASAKLQGLNVRTVQATQTVEAGPFQLEFFGQLHAEIHPVFPRCDNVGVLVNNTLYYPGDSFTLPEKPVPVLALPVSGPWLKVGEVIDFLDAVKPHTCFPTHDAMLSEAGKHMFEDWTAQVCQQHGIIWKALDAGQSMEL